MSVVVECLNNHNLSLVVLAAIICIVGCFTTVLIGSRASHSPAVAARYLLQTAIVFSLSVWSLHFVAMLSFETGAQASYRIDSTVYSIAIVAICALSASFLFHFIQQTALRCVTSGIILACGIAGMHYTGVSAMRSSATIIYDPRYVFASIALAAVFSITAYFRALRELDSIRRKLEVTLWLTLAICGLHFTGMAGLTLLRAAPEADAATGLDRDMLAIIVGIVALVLLASALLAIRVEDYLLGRTRRELGRMRLMSDLSQEIMIIHHDGVVLEANRAAERMFEMPAASLAGYRFLDLFTDDCTAALVRRSVCPVEARRPEQMTLQTASGRRVTVELSCQPIELFGKPCTAVALRDLTQRKRDEEQIIHLARHDAVTGLPNRFNFEERLREALDIAQHDHTTVALLYIDLDKFKSVNDLHGHEAGDAVLREASSRFAKALGPAETLARFGGDEFTALVHCKPHSHKCAAVAQAVVEAAQTAFVYNGKTIQIGCSVGISMFPADATDAASLLRAADTAMYRAKTEGRGGFRLFESSMDEELKQRHELERDLRAACERSEFVLHYQPMVNGVSGEVETFEALIRWDCPSRGMMSPALFIPLAEETGLINLIGKWVIDTACREAASWTTPRRVSVNVSATQIRESETYDFIAETLKRYGLPASRLVVEITESVLISDTGQTVAILQKLSAAGIRIALDDFGTGYSSLSYLQRFKFDKFKIDKSFVDRITQSHDAFAIIKAIINLGHNLGLQVTAEGVETPEQLNVLRSLGCDQMQGYLLSRPRPMTSFVPDDFDRIERMFPRSKANSLLKGVA